MTSNELNLRCAKASRETMREWALQWVEYWRMRKERTARARYALSWAVRLRNQEQRYLSRVTQ